MLQKSGAGKVERFFARLYNRDDSELIMFAPRKKKDDENEEIDDDFNNEEEEEENPFEIEPTDKDIIENDFPTDNPEDDLLDDEEEIPYNWLHSQI